jgi:hypothetical protein
MKSLIIAGVSIFLMAATSCSLFNPKAPIFPEEIKNFYVLDVAEEPVAQDEDFKAAVINPEQLPDFYNNDIQLACLKFEIVSKHPFKIKFLDVSIVTDCRAVGGYQPKDHQLFYNFLDDLTAWAKHREEKDKK